MKAALHIDCEALLREIARYLAAVDDFREELREPTWLPETAPPERGEHVISAR